MYKLVHHRAQRPHVRGRRAGAVRQLRWLVRVRAAAEIRGVVGVRGESREAEVSELDERVAVPRVVRAGARPLQQDVVRLDVAVDDRGPARHRGRGELLRAAVQQRERLRDGEEDVPDEGFGDALPAVVVPLEDGPQVAGVAVLEVDLRESGRGGGGEQLADAGVRGVVRGEGF